MQGTRVWSLVQEDSTYCRAAESMCTTSEPMLCSQRATVRSLCTPTREQPWLAATREFCVQQQRPSTGKNKSMKILKTVKIIIITKIIIANSSHTWCLQEPALGLRPGWLGWVVPMPYHLVNISISPSSFLSLWFSSKRIIQGYFSPGKTTSAPSPYQPCRDAVSKVPFEAVPFLSPWKHNT